MYRVTVYSPNRSTCCYQTPVFPEHMKHVNIERLYKGKFQLYCPKGTYFRITKTGKRVSVLWLTIQDEPIMFRKENYTL